MDKTLSKSSMGRSSLKNRYYKFPAEENHKIFKKQRNYCVNLVNKTKKEYYNNLNPNIFKDIFGKLSGLLSLTNKRFSRQILY